MIDLRRFTISKTTSGNVSLEISNNGFWTRFHDARMALVERDAKICILNLEIEELKLKNILDDFDIERELTSDVMINCPNCKKEYKLVGGHPIDNALDEIKRLKKILSNNNLKF